MHKNNGYKIGEEINKTARITVSKGIEEKSNKNITLYQINCDNATEIDFAHFKQEIEIIKQLNVDEIIKIHQIFYEDNTITLVVDKRSGTLLSNIIHEQKLPLDKTLSLIIKISLAAHKLHEKNIIHKNLNSQSIYIDSKFENISISDFGTFQYLTHEHEDIYNPDLLKNIFPYISPEQTGRLNRRIDYRSDLYSIGIIFYEMLTGILPFQSHDPLELFHAHIAIKPAPPREINREIPEILSQIVEKCLSKNSEDRYQSAFGLIKDCEKCLLKLQKNKIIENFYLGKFDVSEKFNFPQKIYGRDNEINTLTEALNRINKGARELVFIKGVAGIGKSVLVGEFNNPSIIRKGYFISGKFDSNKMSKPYSGIILAFKSLIQRILFESEDRIDTLKKVLKDTLKENSKIITDVIPELELLIGKQPPIQEVGPEESQNRFNLVFQNFIKVFLKKDQPLIIFLDDLHWADEASLNLISTILRDQQSEYLLVIAAYRESEAKQTTYFLPWHQELESLNIQHTTIILNHLKVENINRLLSNSLHALEKDTRKLAEITLNKTEGNPFFIKQFFEILCEENLIFYNKQISNDDTKKYNYWNWNIEAIEEMQVTDNVIDFMVQKINRFSPETLKLLKTAASIGTRFSLQVLSKLNKKSIEETLPDLHELINNHLIYQEKDEFVFSHDRIREAAHSIIPEEERIEIHYQIGLILLNNLKKDQINEQIFSIVEHLNAGSEAIHEDAMKGQLIELNYKAGMFSKTATAYSSAIIYFNYAFNLLPDNTWSANYNLTFELHLELAECNYILGKFRGAEKLYNILFKNASDLLDKVRVYNSKTVLLTNQNLYNEAIANGLEALKLFNINLNEKPGKLKIILAFIKSKIAIKHLSIDDLVNLPTIDDPKKIAPMNIMGTLVQPTYFSSEKHHKELMALIIFNMLNYSVKYGTTKDLPFIFVTYGGILCGRMKDYKNGYTLGQAGVRLSQKLNTISNKTLLTVINAGMINHWTRPSKSTLQELIKAIEYGTDTGDLMATGNAITQIVYHSIRMGIPLEQILQTYLSYYDLLIKTRHDEAILTTELHYHMILLYTGKTNNDKTFSDNYFNEDTFSESLQGKVRLQYNYYRTKVETLYQFGYYAEALEFADIMYSDFEEIMVAVITNVEFTFFFSITITALFNSMDKKYQKKYFPILKRNIKKLKLWAENCDLNFEHQYLLLQAELARISGKEIPASDLFSKAINKAKDGNYLNHEGTACECAARYYNDRKNSVVAASLIKRSIYCFNKWGAHEKVNSLRRIYKDLIDEFKLEIQAPGITPDVSTMLDLKTALNAASAISGEIYLERLLTKLISLVIENAGASRGILILNKEGDLYIEAEGFTEKDEIAILQSIQVEEYSSIPLSIINFIKRTQQTVVLQDACADGIYIDDPYIQSQNILSILCLPIVKQKEMKGIFYLENSFVSGAFSPERVEIIKFLSTDAATSLENALLFEKTRNAEMEIMNQYEEIHNQYETMEAINIELGKTRDELLSANKKLEMFKMFAEETGHGFGMADLNGNQTYANKALSEILGIEKPDDIYGDSIFQYHTKEIIQNMENNILPIVMKKGQWTGESIMLTKNGEKVPVMQNIFLIRNEKDEPFQLASIIIDITDRIEAEKALKESEERYRMLVDTMNEGVAVVDTKGNITYANSRISIMLGYTIEEMLGTSVLDYVNEKEKIAKQLTQKINRVNIPYEIEFITKKGNSIYTIISPQPIYSDNGTYIGSFGVITDITERKKMEEDLLKASKLESLGVFAGGIAHDFNNILTAILGNLSLAKLNLKKKDDNFEILDEAEKASLRAKDLTQQLLTFSKGGAPIKKITSIGNILKDTTDFVLSGSNITCDYKIDKNLLNVKVDPGQISQVIHNLIINARQAMPEGGTIFITAKNVQESSVVTLPLNNTKYICISIIDEGIGIVPESLSQIFDPYFTTKVNGNGLGLAVSYSIIKKHDGIITIESENGKGTRVRLYLPSTDEQLKTTPHIKKEYTKKKANILLMDDDDNVLKVAREMLKRLGHNVRVVSHGEEAIEKYTHAMGQKNPFDLIIMDLTIPGKMGGKDTIAELKKIDPEVKAIVSSGYSNDPILAHHTDYGFCAILVKPYQFDEIKKVLGSIL